MPAPGVVDTNPTISCPFCAKEVVSRYLYPHCSRAHFSDMWTDNNKANLERALRIDVMGPLTVKMMNDTYYLNPVKGCLYTGLKTCERSLKSLKKVDYDAKVREILDYKPAGSPAQAVVSSGPPLADIERDAWKKMVETLVHMLEDASKENYMWNNNGEEPDELDYRVNLSKVNRKAFTVLKTHLDFAPRKVEPKPEEEPKGGPLPTPSEPAAIVEPTPEPIVAAPAPIVEKSEPVVEKSEPVVAAPEPIVEKPQPPPAAPEPESEPVAPKTHLPFVFRKYTEPVPEFNPVISNTKVKKPMKVAKNANQVSL